MRAARTMAGRTIEPEMWWLLHEVPLVIPLRVVPDGRERQGCEGPRVTVTDHHPVQDGEGG